MYVLQVLMVNEDKGEGIMWAKLLLRLARSLRYLLNNTG
jgi:hypothetical protein